MPINDVPPDYTRKAIMHMRLLLLTLMTIACAGDDVWEPDSWATLYLMKVNGPAAAVGTTIGVPVNLVDSISVRLSRVEAIRNVKGRAIYLNLGALDECGNGLFCDGKRVRLLDLPGAAPGVAMAASQVYRGTYDQIRLEFEKTEARITLSDSARIDGILFGKGTHALRVSAQGATATVTIAIPSFTIESNSKVRITLAFDVNATVATLRSAGSGLLEATFIFRAVP